MPIQGGIHMKPYLPALTLVGLLACALTGCASEGSASPAAAPSSAGATSAASPTTAAGPSESASAATSTAATGSLSAKAPDCAKVARPAALKRSMAVPPVMCAYESSTDYVSFAVGEAFARTFDQAAGMESTKISQTTADGWTFGAAWPVADGFTRVQYWLVDADGKVLLCKTGSDRGERGIKDLAEVCNAAKELLYTA